MATKTQIRGPMRIGSGALDEGALTRAVVNSYAGVPEAEARARGQDVAAAVLPLRRRLWALAERCVPERLAAALRSRCAPADPTGRDGVRELRVAIADWLDPPPACRWCRRPIRPDDLPRTCTAPRGPARAAGDGERRAWTPRPIVCRPSRAAHLGAVARCGTLALHAAGAVDLGTIAAAIASPKGAASGYDVAADRDLRALLAATCPEADLPYPVAEPDRWSDEGTWRMYAAVSAAGLARGGLASVVPRSILQARQALQRARDEHARVNGRIAVGIQRRYHSPRDGVTRADLLQGAAIGNDRGVLDYDASQARYTTYGANWARQGCGEQWAGRDLVGCPPWLLDLRRAVDARLRDACGSLPDATDRDRAPNARDLLRAIEAVVEAAARRDPDSRRLALALAGDLVAMLGGDTASARKDPGRCACPETEAPGVCCANGTTGLGARNLASAALAEALPSHLAPRALAALVRPLRRAALGSRPRPPWRAKAKPAEEPERARERLGAWVVARLVAAGPDPDQCPSALRRASGPGLLAALRHGAPVLVQIGSGADDDDAQTQGASDGAGGEVRRAEVLAAHDDTEAREDEADDAARWSVLLASLAELQGRDGAAGDRRGREAAEIVRRHHGLDSVAEDPQGGAGESFASIGASGLRAGGGRTMTKEAVRKIYNRAIAALRDLAAGIAPDLGEDWFDDERRGEDRTTLPPEVLVGALQDRIHPASGRLLKATPIHQPPPRREVADEGAWSRMRSEAAAAF